MFYYRITTEKRGAVATEHREFLSPSYLGDRVSSILAERPLSIRVEPISQRAYIAAMRPKD